MKDYEYHDQGQGLSYLRETAFSFEKAHVDKSFFEGLHCIQIIKQYTCIYNISNLIVSVKGCF